MTARSQLCCCSPYRPWPFRDARRARTQPAPGGGHYDRHRRRAEETPRSSSAAGYQRTSGLPTPPANSPPRDAIYVVAVTEGTSPNSTVTARWTSQDGGQVVEEDSRTIAAKRCRGDRVSYLKAERLAQGEISGNRDDERVNRVEGF